jgi:hypothetical protein
VAKFAGFCFISDTPQNWAIVALWIALGGFDGNIWPELLKAMAGVLI